MNSADETGLTSIVATAYHCSSSRASELRRSAGGSVQIRVGDDSPRYQIDFLGSARLDADA